MKLKFFQLFFCFTLLTIGILSCQKKESYNDLVLSTMEMKLKKGESGTFTINDGSNSYQVKSDNPAIATATLKEKTVTVSAIKSGSTVIVVTDELSGQIERVRISIDIAPLKLSANLLTIKALETQSIQIEQGSGDYQVVSEAPQIASVSLSGNTISVTGVGIGTAWLEIEDKESHQKQRAQVIVEPARYETNISTLLNLFLQPKGTLPEKLALSLLDYKKDKLSENYIFCTSTEKIETTLEYLAVNKNTWFYNVKPQKKEEHKDFYNKISDLLWKDANLKFISAQIGQYDKNGNTIEGNIKVFVKADEFRAAAKQVDMDKALLRIGFIAQDVVFEIRIDKGLAGLCLRPLWLHDIYKWYHFRYIKTNFEEQLLDLFFVVKSSGFIPPVLQLFMAEGKDRNNQLFNLVFFAQRGEPITQIEASYFELNNKLEDAIRYWQELLLAPDVEERFGSFEGTVILPRSNEGNPTRLTSLKATIDWVKNNDLSDVGAVMPIFRIEGERVIIPQLNSYGMVIVMGLLKVEAAQTGYGKALYSLMKK